MEDGVTSIESSTFSNCPKLANIILPRYLYSIGENAFSKCSMLENITIPNSVEIIYQEAFEDCDNLKTIRLLSIAPPLAYDNSFDSYDVILYVPESSIDTYKKTAPWSNFEEIIALTPPITYLELNHTHVLLAEEESFLITTNIASNRDDIPLVWSSDAPDIATVNSEGKVTAIKAGVAKITVTANDGSGLSAICEVEVQKHYVLKYIIEDEVYYTSSVAAGAIITLPEEPTKEGHTFSGWSEVPETMPAKDVTVTGHFTINKYLVTFKIGDEVIAADSLEYGATIVAPEAPDREGYTFDGWGEVAETVPAGNVTYEGTYTVNIYKVYYYVGEELVHTAEVAYGEAIPEYVYEPTAEGDVFMGWIGETYETMPAHDVTYTANIDDAIEQLTIDKSQLTIYDLKGRKVMDTENLKGGIYIVNGKKVVIK